MTTWLPWAPSAEPTREECEALIGRRVRMAMYHRWSTFVVVGVELIDGKLEARGGGLHLGAVLWPIKAERDNDDRQMTEVEAP